MTSVVAAPDASPIAAMMTAYLRELTTDGPFEYPQLARYWSDPDRVAYLIRDEARDVGFVLVRRHPETSSCELAEFYVMPGWRRRGIGSVAARAVFARHPGWWHLQILANNAAAQAFWRSVMPPVAQAMQQHAANGRAFTLLHFRWDEPEKRGQGEFPANGYVARGSTGNSP